jgi:CubicO group peptidase (beta-lactamase class C family)
MAGLTRFGGAAALAIMLAATTLAGCAAQTGQAVSVSGATTATATSAPTTAPTPPADLPRDANILFWTQPQRDTAFRMMERFVPANTVSANSGAAARVHALPAGRPLPATLTISGRAMSLNDYMTAQRLAGLIVLVDGRVRFENYGLGTSATDRWTSFSVAKSFTSTLVGAAIRDGAIRSIDDPVTRYIPDLAGSGYDGVTVAQLLSMRSGVRWNESYTDPNSDVARFNAQTPEGSVDPVTAYMRRLPRAHAPGTVWNYNTGETNLIGVLVERATGKTVSQYLTEKVWQPYGMEADAAWLLNSGGKEISGCCMSMRLRDYARFGEFVRSGGAGVVPDGWFEQAGRRQTGIGRPGFGYGYQWWTSDDGSFAAQGIFGQGIFIDPARRIVIAGVGNWPTATDRTLATQRQAFYEAVQRVVDSRQ